MEFVRLPTAGKAGPAGPPPQLVVREKKPSGTGRRASLNQNVQLSRFTSEGLERAVVLRVTLRQDPVARPLQAVDERVELAAAELLATFPLPVVEVPGLDGDVVDLERPPVTSLDLVLPHGHAHGVVLARGDGADLEG